MAQESQIRDLLQTWLHYIHIENLTNAKVEAGDDEQPHIWDSGVNLVGDKLLLDESLFKQLKQPFKTSKTKPREGFLLFHYLSFFINLPGHKVLDKIL